MSTTTARAQRVIAAGGALALVDVHVAPARRTPPAGAGARRTAPRAPPDHDHGARSARATPAACWRWSTCTWRARRLPAPAVQLREHDLTMTTARGALPSEHHRQLRPATMSDVIGAALPRCYHARASPVSSEPLAYLMDTRPMAHISYTATGTLDFANGVNLTPVIRALFGAFNLNSDELGDGRRAYIAKEEGDNATWAAVLETTQAEVEKLGLQLPPDADPDDLAQWLYVLADDHLKIKELMPELENLLEHAPFDLEDEAQLETLFNLASYLDDGHGLQSCHLEGATYSNRPLLGGFSGDVQFVSKDFVSGSDTSGPLTFARDVATQLAAARTGKATLEQASDRVAEIVTEQVRTLLASIVCPEQLAHVAQKVATTVPAMALAMGMPPEPQATGEQHLVDDHSDGDDEEEEEDVEIEYTVNVSDGHCVAWNPFETNFAYEWDAEEAAKEYMLANPEIEHAIISRIQIVNDMISGDDVHMQTITRDQLEEAEAPRA